MTTEKIVEPVVIQYPSPIKEFFTHFMRNKGAVIGLIFLIIMV